MPLFNFFRSNKTSAPTETLVAPISETSELEKTIDRALFVEDQAPDLDEQLKKPDNHLEIFLNQNFELKGYSDGYSYPETEYLETQLQVYRASFRLAIDKCLDLKRAEIGELRLHRINTSGLSARMGLQLEEKIQILEITVHELDMQKILSVENDGIISGPIHSYRLGFIKGLERYQREKLFAGTIGLFN